MTLETDRNLADAVVADGFDAHWPAVSALLVDARRGGISDVLAEVAADREAPTVARERALGRILVELGNLGDEHRDAHTGSVSGSEVSVEERSAPVGIGLGDKVCA